MLFINCKTGDEKNIICCGPISLHSSNNTNVVSTNSTIEFKSVQPHMDQKSSPPKLCLKIRGNSTVSVIDPETGLKKAIITPNVPLPQDPPKKLRSTGSLVSSIISPPTEKSTEKEKSKLSRYIHVHHSFLVVGMIQNDVVFERNMNNYPDCDRGAYVTTVLPFRKKPLRLIISKNFGNWPILIRLGEVVSFIGERVNFYGMDTILVKRGDYLDLASDEEIALARNNPNYAIPF